MLGVYSIYWPSSLLGYELRQELAKGQASEWFLLLELTLPSGVARYHYKGFASSVLYDGMLIDISSLIRTTPDRQNRMESFETDCTIDDTSNLFAAAVFGSSGRQVRGAQAVLRLASPNVPAAGWFVAFSGVVDQYTMEGANRWKLILRPDDLSLRRDYPKFAITSADFPNAPSASLAQYGPLLYGKHDSGSSTVTGSVPCVYVDNSGFRYLLCWGRASAVAAVYADGVAQVSGWSVVYETVNGRLCTLIDFTSSQGSKAITADASGYEDVGDGTGALIENAADQLAHELTNFVFGDYKSGAWLTTSSRIDLSSFNAARIFFDAFGHRGSRRLFSSAPVKGYSTLNEWATSWQLQPFWKNNGTIAVRVLDYRHLALYPDQTWWIRADRSPYAPNYRPDWENLIDRVSVQYLFNQAAGKYMRSLEVRDPASLLPDSPEALALPYSQAWGG